MSEEALALAPALDEGLERLGLKVEDRGRQQLLQYLALLQRWNSTYNLTAVRHLRAMLTQHLLDCLAVVEPLRRQVGTRPLKLLDVGSGGGLPGVVLACLNPEWQVTCVDTVGKKAAFVRQVAGELGLPNLTGHHGRVEQMNGAFDLIVSRAFASLELFTRLSGHLLAGGMWAAMKGKAPTEEIAALPAGLEVFHVEHLQVPGLDAERCLIWIRPR